MKKTDLPNLTQQPILHIDATPDENYPLRILKAYRENCNLLRAKILDKAIKKLSKK